MIIRIKSCSKPAYWYANHINETFEADPIRDGYLLRDPPPELRVVVAEDCEVVT